MHNYTSLAQRIDAHLGTVKGAIALPYDESRHPNLGEENSIYRVINIPVETHRTRSFVIGPIAPFTSIQSLNDFLGGLIPDGIRPKQREDFLEMQGRWLRHGHLLFDDITFGHSRGSNGRYVDRTILTVLPYAPDQKALKKFETEKHLFYATPLENLESLKAAGFE